MILRNYNITYVLSFSNTDIDVASRNAILIKFKCVQLKFATLDIARLPTVLLFIYNCSPFAFSFCWLNLSGHGMVRKSAGRLSL